MSIITILLGILFGVITGVGLSLLISGFLGLPGIALLAVLAVTA